MTVLKENKTTNRIRSEKLGRLLNRFVDDFRYYKNASTIAKPLPLTHERWDALLASTVEYLCEEAGLEPPEWLQKVPACKIPCFVSGMENLKAIALVESPLQFRRRKIFVLENLLSRV